MAKERKWMMDIRGDRKVQEFARSIKVPPTTYNSWEKGHRTPKPEYAKQVAPRLGVPWTKFYEDIA